LYHTQCLEKRAIILVKSLVLCIGNRVEVLTEVMLVSYLT